MPAASQRAMSPGDGLYVDANAGDDANDGTRESPWRTIHHAAALLKPGDVLYLRGGVYYEHVAVKAHGTSDKPM